MKDGNARTEKLFTVDEANRMLPLVGAITRDFVDLTQELTERRHRLNHLLEGRELEQSDVYSDELAEVERGIRRDSERLREYLQELRQLGVQPRGDEGLVDFPSDLDGRRVYLCWKLGEPEVMFWHETDEGFAGRQPLPTASIEAGESATDGTLGEPEA